MAVRSQRLMLESEIPDFVDEVIRAGCDIYAVDKDKYLLGDGDVVDEVVLENVLAELDRIDEKYGDRDFLQLKIVAYLRSLGRYIDDPKIAHWSQNPKPN